MKHSTGVFIVDDKGLLEDSGVDEDRDGTSTSEAQHSRRLSLLLLGTALPLLGIGIPVLSEHLCSGSI